jgi:hypothetical protein
MSPTQSIGQKRGSSPAQTMHCRGEQVCSQRLQTPRSTVIHDSSKESQVSNEKARDEVVGSDFRSTWITMSTISSIYQRQQYCISHFSPMSSSALLHTLYPRSSSLQGLVLFKKKKSNGRPPVLLTAEQTKRSCWETLRGKCVFCALRGGQNRHSSKLCIPLL